MSLASSPQVDTDFSRRHPSVNSIVKYHDRSQGTRTKAGDCLQAIFHIIGGFSWLDVQFVLYLGKDARRSTNMTSSPATDFDYFLTSGNKFKESIERSHSEDYAIGYMKVFGNSLHGICWQVAKLFLRFLQDRHNLIPLTTVA